MDKRARLQIVYSRLQAAPPASTGEEAYKLLCDTIDEVEDEHSGVPNDPLMWRTDGRLYPPQPDRAFVVPGFSEMVRYNSLKHDTYIAGNGAIEVRIIATDAVAFAKPGADGKGVWE